MNCPDVDVFVFEFKSSIQRNEPNWSSKRIEAFVQEKYYKCVQNNSMLFIFYVNYVCQNYVN